MSIKPFSIVFGFLSISCLASAAPTFTEIGHPAAAPPYKAELGSSVAILDYDGDGKADIAAGAPGENKVYVFFGDSFERHIALEPPNGRSSARFGHSLAAGEIDGVSGEELVAGSRNDAVGEVNNAGRVFVFGRHMEQPVVLESLDPKAGEHLGNSVAVGDYDNDGKMEIASGASRQPETGLPGGRVYIFDLNQGRESSEPVQRVFENHQTDIPGNFGNDLATADWNNDGIDDLFISAIFNRNSLGVVAQGEMIILVGPFGADGAGPAEKIILEENVYRTDDDFIRFGMSIDARDHIFAIGSPRKTVIDVNDAGMGHIRRKDHPPVYFSPEDRIENGILGYRARIGDFIGDEKLDAAFFSLPAGIYIWESCEMGDPVFIPRPIGACAHWCCGAAVGQLFPGGKEELVMGGSDWGPEGAEKAKIGRLHIVRFD